MKKTFIKVGREIARNPEHRQRIGKAIWLYLYVLDGMNWTTGKVHEWRDDAAAAELAVPVATLRDWRRHLETEGYIRTSQAQHCLVVEVLEHSYQGDKNLTPWDSEGDEILTPSAVEGDEKLTPWNNEGDEILTPWKVEGDTQGDTQGAEKLTPSQAAISENHRITISEGGGVVVVPALQPQRPARPGGMRAALEDPDIGLFHQVSGVFPGSVHYTAIQDAVQLLRQTRPGVDLAQYLGRFWVAWAGRAGKDGQQYDRRNPAWLTEWAINDFIPGEKGGSVKAVTGKGMALLEKRRATRRLNGDAAGG